ncbi:MAG: HD domain-containing protein [Desulfovibrio sp.]|nr:HD domain-containing protein [Desulfovibrio sp.]
MRVPPQAVTALRILEINGRQAFIVGGAVRDMAAGLPCPADWDIATDAPARDVLSLFSAYRVIETGLKHGTVTVIVDGLPMEITTFRGEKATLEGDLALRDFTINALAWSPESGIIDPFGGLDDIRTRTLRAVGSAEARMREDPLRILRAMRFASQMAFTMDGETAAMTHALRHLLANVAVERIRTELTKTFCGRNAGPVLRRHPDVMATVIPETAPMIGLDQRNPYHCRDVWDHTVEVLANTPADPVLRWAAFFHDMGKPDTFTVDAKGIGHFHGHPLASMRHAEEIMDRLKFDSDSREKILFLVGHHDVQMPVTVRGAKKAMQTFGLGPLRQLIPLIRADAMGQSALAAPRLERCGKFSALLAQAEKENGAFSRADLAVNGDDIAALGFKGREIGRMLETLVSRVVFEGLANERDALLAYAKSADADRTGKG